MRLNGKRGKGRIEAETGLSTFGLFSSGDASAILKISRRKVSLYVEQGIIDPSLDSGGRGRERGFSFLDLLRMSIALQLEAFGVAPRFLRLLVAEVHDDAILGDRELMVFVRVGDRGNRFRARFLNRRQSREFLRKGPRRGLFALDLHGLIDDLQERVGEQFGS